MGYGAFIIHGARVGIYPPDSRMADEFGLELLPIITGRARDCEADVLAVYDEQGGTSSRTGDGTLHFDAGWEGAENFEVADGVRVYLDYGRLAVKISARDGSSFDESLLALVNLVEYMLRLHMHRSRPLAVFHAAAWEVGGAGILLPGASGAGKTSLSFIMEAAGHLIISDEDSFVVRGADGLTLLPYPRRLRVGGGLLAAYPELHNRAARPYSAFGGEGLLFEHDGRPACVAPLAAVVFLDNDPAHTGPPMLTPLTERARVLYSLLGSGEYYPADNAHGPMKAEFAAFNRALFGIACEAVDKVPAWRLVYDITRQCRLIPEVIEELASNLMEAGRV
ncbi:MAG: hypothetical protein HZA22_04185 [Nitrospirae bacterium]|nr:hypothetical protein [Nitrospirota bacterium]MBI5694935.1 hypothetical protein [Nitrospirota bacterium]